MYIWFFFFKQKTAYEMRISDWSSDVCSSDLLAPQDEEYRRLSEAYLKYQSQASHETLETIPAGALIKQGNVDFRVPSIAERLRGEGYLTSYQDITADRYTLEMAEAVRRLQADHGIKADGVVGADTLQVLNTGAAERARQLADRKSTRLNSRH